MVKAADLQVMDVSSSVIDLINGFMRRAYDTEFSPSDIIRKIDDEDAQSLLLESAHKPYPGLIRIIESNNGSMPRIIPYHLIREKHNRQISSFWIGRGLCNLSEIKQWSGCLYSRYAPSYEPDELPHRDANRSKIGLWIHDCLTEDFDHHPSLNRATLCGGIVMSYDFGMAFSHPYFPPFYTFELNIEEADLIADRQFVVTLLADYARKTQFPEQDFIDDVHQLFPAFINPDLCRYYFRNFRTYIFKRIRLSRVFEKIRNTPFSSQDIKRLLDYLEIPAAQIKAWQGLQLRLSELSRNRLDLRGLNLSNADFRKAGLMGADLREASFHGSDLRRANLSGADLTGTDLREADLRGAVIEPDRLKLAIT